MLVEVCTITRATTTATSPVGRQTRSFTVIASGVSCLMQQSSGGNAQSGGSSGSSWSDPGFVPSYNWRVFLKQGQDIKDGDRVVSAKRGFTAEVVSVISIITPGNVDGHHLEVRVRQLVNEGP